MHDVQIPSLSDKRIHHNLLSEFRDYVHLLFSPLSMIAERAI